jgi:hypothetical protein
MVVVDQLADPQEAGRVRSGQRLDPLVQLLGVLAADRNRSRWRPQRGGHDVSCGGVALVVAQEHPGKEGEELEQQPLSPVVIRDRPARQGIVEERLVSALLILGRSSGTTLRPLSVIAMAGAPASWHSSGANEHNDPGCDPVEPESGRRRVARSIRGPRDG